MSTRRSIQPVIQRFNMDKSIISELKSRTPNFGFNGLGELVFRRTYSRDNEDWADVVVRVIEGCMSIRKEHFFRNTLRWVDSEWQSFTREMAHSLFSMEWLPPGRGLWMMGTEFTYERGSMALNNCAATDTKDDIVHSAEWTMDGLMNGVGVGFTTNWRGTAKAADKKDSETYLVQDSREGWVESLIKLMCSYICSPRYGENKFPIFDYSSIRPPGSPIKGFGGTASGPAPLKQMHKRIEGYLDAFCMGRLKCKSKVWKEFKNNETVSEWKEVEVNVDKPYSHTRLVADIFNAIGACVVAGNVRRSAEISLGDANDEDFINLKNYQINPERGEIGWMSNNSVVLKADKGFEDFSCIPDMARRIRDNGEPGMINLYNIQRYGRFGKEKLDEATLVNPCFSGDTLIAVADGRGAIRIDQLAKEDLDVPVYSMDEVSGEVSIQWGRHPRVTGTGKKLLRIHFDGSHNDQYMDVTPNHKFFLNDGRTVEAKDLKKGDSLPQFKKTQFTDKYVRVYTPSTKKYRVEHRMIKEFYDKEKFYKTYKEGTYNGCCRTHSVVVHHKDENKLNNHPDNLEITTAAEHNRIHNQEYVGEGNPMYGKQHSDETKDLIRQKVIERCQNPEYRNKLSLAQTSELREQSRKSMTIMRAQELKEYYDSVEQEPLGLFMIRISDTELKVIRTCENENCKLEFLVHWAKRERAYCSHSCANTKKESIELRKKGQSATFEAKAKENFHKQAMIYKDLCLHMEIVQKKNFEQACKEQKISCRFNAKSDNPWIPSGWTHFKQMVDDHNHRVSWVEELEGEHEVYNITVEKNHTLAVVTKSNDDFSSLSGVFTKQCGEIPLENFELCNLAETFPPRCANENRFYKALEYATFYSSTVSLLPTHRPETNAVIAKNRRIGISISGIAQWASGVVPEEWGAMNYTRMGRILRQGYKIVLNKNTLLAKAAGVPESVRITTVKPSGSISLLAGVTPGVHYPVSRYAIRRVRIGMSSPLIQPLKDAGVPYEKDKVSENTYVFEFVIDHGEVRPCQEVSPWEQFSLVQMMQKHYADNSVSATIYFDKEKDGPDVEKMLAMFIPNLKSVSMLPHSGHGYVQAPYEPLTKEEYRKRLSGFTYPKYNNVKGNVPVGSKFCSGDRCEL
jgi:intein/homing endonuclease